MPSKKSDTDFSPQPNSVSLFLFLKNEKGKTFQKKSLEFFFISFKKIYARNIFQIFFEKNLKKNFQKNKNFPLLQNFPKSQPVVSISRLKRNYSSPLTP